MVKNQYHMQGPQIHQFNHVQGKPVPRSMFKRDFTRRMTFNQDYLVPIMIDEILPGDDIKVKMTAFCRMATPIKPLMDNLYLETFWFFVPNRLVWDNWKKFQGEQINPADSVAYTVPKLDKTKAPLSTTGFAVESVYDYLGLPVLVTGIDNISSLYNRAYDLIWNEWFRDENLQDSITVLKGDAADDPALYTLRKRNKRKDYFTSCLPWPQKGTAVTVSLGGLAPVIGIGKQTNVWADGSQNVYETGQTTGTVNYPGAASFNGTVANNTWVANQNGSSGYPAIYADLSRTTNTLTMNTLRQSALYQQILELDARGGTRYVEAIYNRFGVVSPDFRLQRPELIGQGSSRINIYAVPQTTPTPATGTTTPQGNMAAYGTASVEHACSYSATEHGMLIGLANVRADLTYQQGVPRHFLRQTRLDFYEPLLNGLGEQSVTNKEIYATGTSTDDQVFGYQERFADYRYKRSEICGKFRSGVSGSLDVWHLSQQFGSLPALNSSFITEGVPMARISAVPSEPQFLMDAFYDYTHVRPMPIRSNPGIDIL